jgi:hypothetical protein
VAAARGRLGLALTGICRHDTSAEVRKERFRNISGLPLPNIRMLEGKLHKGARPVGLATGWYDTICPSTELGGPWLGVPRWPASISTGP